jgi:ATP-dependent protease ClpP protease subunit
MSQEPVTIVIDSPGGDTDVAWAIVSTIQKHGQVTCWVRGRAMSAAFTVLQSCKTRTMTKESVLMMHAPYFEVSNAKLDMQSLAGMLSELQTSTERIAEFCATRMNLPSQMVYERLLSGNWYIGSRTALAMGAIDSVE